MYIIYFHTAVIVLVLIAIAFLYGIYVTLFKKED